MSFPRKRESEFELDDEIDFPEDTEYFFIALFHTIKKLNIPVEEFRNLLKAFKQDAVKSGYKNFDELLDYSKNSANPIGHLVLYVFGYNPVKDSFAFETSDKICTALQLINFWQDVKRDLQIERVYIPEEIMIRNKYSWEVLFNKVENENFRNVIKELVDRTEKLFDEGKGITGYVGGRLKYELKATIFGGMEVIKKIRKMNYNVLSKRPYIKNIDKLKLLIQILWK